MSIISKLLSLLPPEKAHDLAVKAMKCQLLAPGICVKRDRNGELYRLFGVAIDNPIGLAAGFDKAGVLVDVADVYGWGWIEVGSVTFKGGPGNPKPRLFRLPGRHLLNRMGLNGPPASEIYASLLSARQASFAVNIAKSHDPTIVGDAAISDVLSTYKLLCRLGICTVINVSCPNTREGKTFERPAALKELLLAIKSVRPPDSRPLLIKLSPHESYAQLFSITEASADLVDGYVSCNTRPYSHSKFGRGGFSGPSTFSPNVTQVQGIIHMTGKSVIACGGIENAYDARAYLDAGAVACQVYTGFVRGPLAGPRFAHTINNELEKLNGNVGQGARG